VQRFFAVTSVLIMFVATGLFSAGIGRLQSLGWLPAGDPLWDTSWLLDDRGSVGGFLAGLVGYRARPSALEVTGYLLYLAGAIALFLPTVFGRGTRRNGNVIEPAAPSRV
jgi:high-affinity iron transporter